MQYDQSLHAIGEELYPGLDVNRRLPLEIRRFDFFALVEAGGVARLSLGDHAIGLCGAARG